MSSSETTRETSFNFDAYNNYMLQINRSAKATRWLTWFVGFAEGGGGFLISRERCRFVLTQKKDTVLKQVSRTLGVGTVRFFPSGSYYLYDFSIPCPLKV